MLYRNRIENNVLKRNIRLKRNNTIHCRFLRFSCFLFFSHKIRFGVVLLDTLDDFVDIPTFEKLQFPSSATTTATAAAIWQPFAKFLQRKKKPADFSQGDKNIFSFDSNHSVGKNLPFSGWAPSWCSFLHFLAQGYISRQDMTCDISSRSSNKTSGIMHKCSSTRITLAANGHHHHHQQEHNQLLMSSCPRKSSIPWVPILIHGPFPSLPYHTEPPTAVHHCH